MGYTISLRPCPEAQGVGQVVSVLRKGPKPLAVTLLSVNCVYNDFPAGLPQRIQRGLVDNVRLL